MKRILSTKPLDFQVRISQSELKNSTESLPRKKDVFNVMDFVSLLISNLNSELLLSIQNQIATEIINRTSLLWEMIPDDIWTNIFRMLAKDNDLSKVFHLREVNKRWYNCLPDSLNEATIDHASSLKGIPSLRYLHCLIIETPCNISREIIEKCFPNIRSLSLRSDEIEAFDVPSQLWTQMTNLQSLDFSDHLSSYSLINRHNFTLLTNLLSLKLHGDKYNLLKNTSSFIINVTNLSRFANLTKLNNWYDNDLCHATFESRYGPNYQVLSYLKSLKIAKLKLYLAYLNCEEIQRNYPHIRFRWRFFDQIYEGQFSGSNYSGKGTMSFLNSEERYEGDFVANFYSGKGVVTYADNERYEGEFKFNFKEGIGKYEYSDGRCYDGEWKRNERHGEGMITYPNGDRFEGQFVDSQIKLNHGILTYANGDRYEGEFILDYEVDCDDILLKEGRGVMIYQNRDRYEGEWNNNKREGVGIIIFASGGYYDGSFKNDKKEGKGTMVYPNGDRYEGEWKNDEKV